LTHHDSTGDLSAIDLSTYISRVSAIFNAKSTISNMKPSSICATAALFGIAIAATQRGLIIIDSAHEQTDMTKYFSSPDLKWVYNYTPQPPNSTAYANLSFVPMLYGPNDSNDFLAQLKGGPNYSYVLGFNEPDMPTDVGGTNIPVNQAVQIWQTQIQPLKQLGYTLGSPAGTSPESKSAC
jgi:Glycosyl hydrolase catalytic core